MGFSTVSTVRRSEEDLRDEEGPMTIISSGWQPAIKP